MIPRGVYTPQGFIACPLYAMPYSRGHVMVPRRVCTPRNHGVPSELV